MKYLSFLVLFLLTINAHAQNNQRKGFILGIGVGPSLHSSVNSGRESMEFSTNFKIGFATSNKLSLYWNSQVDWFNQERWGEKELFVYGIGGLGMTYYVNEKAPSLIINALIGVSSVSSLETSSGGYFGLGVGVGLGYEFARHWSTEINFTYGKPKRSYYEQEIGSARLTVNYLMY